MHKRTFSIHIDNPIDKKPSCTFQQERVVEIDGEIIREPIGELRVEYDPTDERALQLYNLLKDYYLALISPKEIAEVEEGSSIEEDENNG